MGWYMVFSINATPDLKIHQASTYLPTIKHANGTSPYGVFHEEMISKWWIFHLAPAIIVSDCRKLRVADLLLYQSFSMPKSKLESLSAASNSEVFLQISGTAPVLADQI